MPGEASEITQQFRSPAFLYNRQSVWSEMLREEAQQWADKRGMQTVITAMCVLINPKHPSCL